jgi:hypothetical protein
MGRQVQLRAPPNARNRTTADATAPALALTLHQIAANTNQLNAAFGKKASDDPLGIDDGLKIADRKHLLSFSPTCTGLWQWARPEPNVSVPRHDLHG